MGKYYSQYYQDKIIDKLLKEKNNGFFIEIGAHNGITFSNSFFFEKYRNWKGICIEPNKTVFKELDKNRKCIKICAGVAAKCGISNFIKVEGNSEMLSGLKDNYTREHFERLKQEIAKNGGSYKEINIETVTFDFLISKYNLKNIDFVSIDTEGNELEILKTINFKKVNITLILVENNYKNKELTLFLNDNGYVLIKELSSDELYIRKDKFNVRYFLSYKYYILRKKISYFIRRLIKTK